MSILLDYDNKVSELLERGRIELVEALNIDPVVYEESIYQIQQSEYRADFFVLEQSIGRRLKEKMLRKRRLSDKTAT
jgi:predicted nucleotidyltransferase